MTKECTTALPLLRRHDDAAREQPAAALPAVRDPLRELEEVRATLDEGVLGVRVPKPEHAKRRRIQIQRG